ncbi:hypothetical protein MRX96_018039 [Rhipicephalus microplus]
MSIASVEAMGEREVSRKSLATVGETITPTGPEANEIALESKLRGLLPVPAGARESEAASAAPTVSGCGGTEVSVRVA